MRAGPEELRLSAADAPLSHARLAAGERAAHGYAAAWAFDGCGAGTVVRTTYLAAPQAATIPTPDEVLLWIGAPGEEALMRSLAAAVLDEESYAVIERLRNEADRAAAFAAHAGVRTALGVALGYAPRDIRFERGTFGKPRLAGSDALHFSLSHTRGAWGFALAARPVGFDVERMHPFDDMDAVAELSFAPEMRAALAAAPLAEKPMLFYRFWTLGEAYIKATGLGVSQGLQSFAFAPTGQPRLMRASPEWGPPERWRFGVVERVMTS